MKNHHKLLPLVMVLTGILSISSCQKFGEGVHETWVEPPKKALVDDSTLTSTVKASLLTDPELSGLDLQVEARSKVRMRCLLRVVMPVCPMMMSRRWWTTW